MQPVGHLLDELGEPGGGACGVERLTRQPRAGVVVAVDDLVGRGGRGGRRGGGLELEALEQGEQRGPFVALHPVDVYPRGPLDVIGGGVGGVKHVRQAPGCPTIAGGHVVRRVVGRGVGGRVVGVEVVALADLEGASPTPAVEDGARGSGRRRQAGGIKHVAKLGDGS